MKARKGYVYEEEAGRWYARFTNTDNGGRRHNVKRRVQSKSHGNEVLKQLIGEFDKGGAEQVEAGRVDFNQLCDFYEKHYLMDAKYVNNRKVAGLRSASSVRGYVKVFREHFGRQRLKDITYEHIRTFRNSRLCGATHQSKQRSLATVNRELAYLRRLFNIAERNGWVGKNPFKKGDALIHTSDEVKRERILTFAEERSLLSKCTGRRKHLKPLIVAAIDTGCRQGELFKLRWSDINFVTGLITIRAFNTKTMRERSVSMTLRVLDELQGLVNRDTAAEHLVFGITVDVRGSFRRACKEAGLSGLRFHDLRHTHATRLDELGFSLAKIGGQLGHTVVQTTLRYVNRNNESAQQIANELDRYNSINDG